MKVLHIITGLNDGGAEAVLFRLLTHDTSNEHIVVSMMDSGKYGNKFRDINIRVYCLNLHRLRSIAQGVFLLLRLLSKEKPNVVQTWMYHANFFGGILARLIGVKTVVWGIRQCEVSLDNNKFFTFLIIRISALFSYIIPSVTVSCAQKAIDNHQKIGFSKRKFYLVPNGYDLSSFYPNEDQAQWLKKEIGIPNENIVLGMVARFDIQKDHNNLFLALRAIKNSSVNFTCLLIGYGMVDSNITITNSLDKLGLRSNIVLMGAQDDIPSLMNVIDLHILSSRGEAFPNVLAEAMACGTPCVTTNAGDAAFIVGNTGWVVPPINHYALAKTIEKAIEMKKKYPCEWKERKYLSRKRIVNNFDVKTMVRNYNSIWSEGK